MKDKLFAINDYCVSCVCATLVANDKVCFFSEEVIGWEKVVPSDVNDSANTTVIVDIIETINMSIIPQMIKACLIRYGRMVLVRRWKLQVFTGDFLYSS